MGTQSTWGRAGRAERELLQQIRNPNPQPDQPDQLATLTQHHPPAPLKLPRIPHSAKSGTLKKLNVFATSIASTGLDSALVICAAIRRVMIAPAAIATMISVTTATI